MDARTRAIHNRNIILNHFENNSTGRRSDFIEARTIGNLNRILKKLVDSGILEERPNLNVREGSDMRETMYVKP